MVSYIQRGHEIVTKTIHHAMNISSTKAELFAIRCDISQATQIQDITHICYELKLKVLSNKTTLVLSNTRELNRVPSTK